jgi:hypothetical protein
MHDRVIWPEKHGPKTSAIDAPNDSGSLGLYRPLWMVWDSPECPVLSDITPRYSPHPTRLL